MTSELTPLRLNELLGRPLIVPFNYRRRLAAPFHSMQLSYYAERPNAAAKLPPIGSDDKRVADGRSA
jgi:hypothetical protein